MRLRNSKEDLDRSKKRTRSRFTKTKNLRLDHTSKRTSVDKSRLANVIMRLTEPVKPVRNLIRNCDKADNFIMWESATLIVRYIRRCVITHNWKSMVPLLLQLINKKRNPYSSYIREMSFFALLMHTQHGHEDLLQDFIKLCFVRLANSSVARKHDVWFVDNKTEQ